MDGSLGGEGFASKKDTKLEEYFTITNYVRHSFSVLMIEMLRMMIMIMIMNHHHHHYDDDDD